MSPYTAQPPLPLLHYARVRGQAAGKVATSQESECPFKDSTKLRQEWLNGFADGRRELRFDPPPRPR